MANQSLMYKWPEPPNINNNFPTEWISINNPPYANSRIIVYSLSLGVVMGFCKIARKGKSWRTEYMCIRKSDLPNAGIITDVVKWCYAPKP